MQQLLKINHVILKTTLGSLSGSNESLKKREKEGDGHAKLKLGRLIDLPKDHPARQLSR